MANLEEGVPNSFQLMQPYLEFKQNSSSMAHFPLACCFKCQLILTDRILYTSTYTSDAKSPATQKYQRKGTAKFPFNWLQNVILMIPPWANIFVRRFDGGAGATTYLPTPPFDSAKLEGRFQQQLRSGLLYCLPSSFLHRLNCTDRWWLRSLKFIGWSC